MNLACRFSVAAVIVAMYFIVMPLAYANPQSSVWLSYSEDEDAARDAFLDLYWALTNDDNVSIGIGQYQSEFLGQEVISNQYHIGYETLRTAPSSMQIFYEYLGKNREFELHTTGIGYGYHTGNMSLGLNAQYREINLYSRTFDFGQLKIDLSSAGYGPEIFFYSGNLTLFVSGMWYDYSEDVSRLASVKALFLLGRQNYNRTSIMNDWEIIAGLQYKFVYISIGVQYGQSRSAIDQVLTDVYTLILKTDLGEQWMLELEGGEVDEELSDAIAYGRIGIGFRF